MNSSNMIEWDQNAIKMASYMTAIETRALNIKSLMSEISYYAHKANGLSIDGRFFLYKSKVQLKGILDEIEALERLDA